MFGCVSFKPHMHMHEVEINFNERKMDLFKVEMRNENISKSDGDTVDDNTIKIGGCGENGHWDKATITLCLRNRNTPSKLAMRL